ncbi:MAG: hypothetical protein NC914_00485 [Candidatus Omnitrophica bacterium]|nr:hypothetical protein [Candidatus Omnitrophota bacterium]
MKKQKIKPLIKFIVAALIAVALLAYLVKAVWGFCRNSDYFRIKEVSVINNAVDFPTLKGENIFSLDLKWLSAEIQKKCPDQKLVRVSRFMPNRIVIEFEKRVPLAVVKLERDYFVDSQMVLFDLDLPTAETQLAAIYGLEINSPKLGAKCKNVALEAALNLILEAGRLGLTKKYPIKRIDVSQPEYLNFSILDDLKIRIAPQDIPAKLNVLMSLITQVNMDLSKVEYIDLRFKDPVIKLKVVK